MCPGLDGGRDDLCGAGGRIQSDGARLPAVRVKARCRAADYLLVRFALLVLLALPLLVYLVVRLFFYRTWVLFKIQWHMANGRYDRALPLLRKQLVRLRRTRGESHLDTVFAKYSLGQIEYEHGRKEEGRRLVDEAAASLAGFAGPRDVFFVRQLLNLGVALRAIEQPDRAIDTFRQAAELEKEISGPDSRDLASALLNLGAVLEESGRAEEAVPIYEESLRIRTKIHGAQSPEVARALSNLGEAYTTLRLWGPAEHNVRQALNILEAAPTHDLGLVYDTYARLLEEHDRLTEADEIRTKSLAALTRALGTGSVEVAKQMEKHAALLERLNRRTECGLLRKKAAAIREALA